MMVRILSAAESEFTDAAVYYEDNEPGLGETFIEHLESAISSLESNPRVGAQIHPRIRKVSLSRFPFSIIYFLSDTELVIVAIAHHKRQPEYWVERIIGQNG